MPAALHPHFLSRAFTSLTSKAGTAVLNGNGYRGSKPLRSILKIMHTWLKRWTILTPSYVRVLVTSHPNNLLTEAIVSPKNSFLSLSLPLRLFPTNHGETDYQDPPCHPSRPNNTSTTNEVSNSIYPNFTAAILCPLGDHIPWAELDKHLHLFHSLIADRNKAIGNIRFIK